MAFEVNSSKVRKIVGNCLTTIGNVESCPWQHPNFKVTEISLQLTQLKIIVLKASRTMRLCIKCLFQEQNGLTWYFMGEYLSEQRYSNSHSGHATCKWGTAHRWVKPSHGQKIACIYMWTYNPRGEVSKGCWVVAMHTNKENGRRTKYFGCQSSFPLTGCSRCNISLLCLFWSFLSMQSLRQRQLTAQAM